MELNHGPARPAEIGLNRSRSALIWGCRHLLGLKAGDAILVPEYICRVVPDALHAVGFETVAYRQTRFLRTDFADLESKAARSRARAILFIHYFGVAENPEPYREIAARRGLFLIEDAAHVFGGTWKGLELGTLGDFSVQSVWKRCRFLTEALCGPACRWPRPRPDGREREQRPCCWRRCASSSKNVSCCRHRLDARWRGREGGAGFLSHESEALATPKRWSDEVARAVAVYDPAVEAQKRRAGDRDWRAWAGGAGLEPLFAAERVGDSSPWVTPVLAVDPTERDLWLRKLHMQGVKAGTWPRLPETAQREPQVLELWRRLIVLPIEPWSPQRTDHLP